MSKKKKISIVATALAVILLVVCGSVFALNRSSTISDSKGKETVAQASKPSSQSKKDKTTAKDGGQEADSKDQDQYHTDPVPEGKPKPVEPKNNIGNSDSNKSTSDSGSKSSSKGSSSSKSSSNGGSSGSSPAPVTKPETQTDYVYISVDCKTILRNMDKLKKGKEGLVGNGIILPKQKVPLYKGESAFDVLYRVLKAKKIHMEFEWTPMYNSNYVSGINNLYEFDCGGSSGWMYNVNGWYPNYGLSRYALKSGDYLQLRYTCQMGDL